MFGDEFFAEHARTAVGMPWRCSTAAFLHTAVATVDSLDPVAARARFSSREIADLHADTSPPGDDDDHDDDDHFDEALQSLRDVSAYYRTVAERGLDVMVIEY